MGERKLENIRGWNGLPAEHGCRKVFAGMGGRFRAERVKGY